jgi:TRAP-type mannitol/chloroaromatic compound transport system permease small subunit
MIEDNERLLQQFFSEAASQQIADNGFTERVMQRLPLRTNWFVRIWNTVCILLFTVLFVVFRGWDLLIVQFEVMLRTAATQTFSVNLMMVFAIVFGLLLVGVGEVISSETVRKSF